MIDYSLGDWTKNSKAHGMDVVLDPFSWENRATVLASGCKVLAPRAHYLDIASSPNTLVHADPLYFCIPEASAGNLINAAFLCAWTGLTNLYERLLGRSNRAWSYRGPTFVRASGPHLRLVRKLAAQGSVVPVIEKIFPFTLSGCRAAFDQVFGGHSGGKIVVTMPSPVRQAHA